MSASSTNRRSKHESGRSSRAEADPFAASIGLAAADKVTRAEELRLQLADEIVRGVLPPGSALDETDIARRFNVSRTPVREALRQLVASGLVESRAHRGAVVARPSLDRLTEMFEAMAELEALCAGLAAERMPPADRAEAGSDPRGIAGAEPCRQSRTLSRSQRTLPQRDLCRFAERLHRRDDAGDAGARAAVPPRPVPQPRAAGEIARRTRPRRGRDHARRQDRRRGRDARAISNWCAGSTSFTRCRCRSRHSGAPNAANPESNSPR